MLSVKGIFKTLIGTIVIMIVTTLIIEIFNINTTGMQIRQLTKMAARQSCVLFSQETYKEQSSTYSNRLPDVVDNTGGQYISGNLYGDQDAETTYRNLYSSGTFEAWCNSTAVTKGNWQNVKLINMGLNTSLQTGASAEDIELSKAYSDMMLTPLNLGIPYLDKDTLNKIFQWNLASLTSNCDSDLIIPADGSAQAFVRYKGFKIYASMASITNLEYIVLDLEETNDRSRFHELTNIDPDDLGFSDAATEDERRRVCLVAIEYSIPMSYEGITPLANILNFASTYGVEGIDGANNSPTGIGFDEHNMATLESGGTAIGSTPSSGKLLYYVIR